MADLVANLPSSYGTSCSVGAYFTNLDLWRKKGEGFNVESSTDIQVALSEEVGSSKKGLHVGLLQSVERGVSYFIGTRTFS